MPSIIKSTLKLAAVLAVLLIVLATGAYFTFDPNQYKPEIEQFALDATGLELNIAGEIGFNLRPYVGLSLNDVRIRNPEFPQELASTSSLSLKVDLRQLIAGSIVVEQFRADDFHINLITDATGKNIWDTSGQSYDSAVSTAATSREPRQSNEQEAVASLRDDSDSGISVAMKEFSIANASIDVNDMRAGTRVQIERLNIFSQDTNLDGNPFSLETSFDYRSGLNQPLRLGFKATPTINRQTGEAILADVQFNVTPVLLRGDIKISGLNATPTYEGTLQSNSFPVGDLVAALQRQTEGAAPRDAEEQPGYEQAMTLSLAFAGTDTELNINSLQAQLGEMLVDMNAEVRMPTELQPLNIRYELRGNDLDLTPFMAVEEAETSPLPDTEPTAPQDDAIAANTTESAAAATTTAAAEPLPFELLNEISLLGAIAIDSLKAGDTQLGAINAFTNIESGVLDIETQPITAFGGEILGTLRVDARAAEASMETRATLTDINVVDLALSIPDLEAVTGQLDVDIKYSSSGNTIDDLLDRLDGATTFAVTENSVDIGVIKQVFTSITALSPNGGETVQQWPDVIQFSNLSGYLLIDGGIKTGQDLRLRMDNIDLAGTGGIDLSTSSFDYDFSFTLLGEPAPQTIQIDELYHDVSWPVSCASQIGGPVTQYCRPDFTRVRDIFAQMATNEVQRRLTDELSEQVPEGLQDAARGLLRGLLDN